MKKHDLKNKAGLKLAFPVLFWLQNCFIINKSARDLEHLYFILAGLLLLLGGFRFLLSLSEREKTGKIKRFLNGVLIALLISLG